MNKRLIEKIHDELQPVDMQERYDDLLDEIYSFKDVGGPFQHMLPSSVLKECDETAYRCGLSDFIDSESDNLVEVDHEYYDKDKVDDLCDECIAEVEQEIAALEAKIGDDEPSSEAEQSLLDLQAALRELERKDY